MPDFNIIDFRERTDKCRASNLWSDRLLTEFLDRWAQEHPEKLAIVDSRGRMTYGELQAQSLQCAAALLKLGLNAGDVMTLQLPNWREWTVLHLAATRIGVITNPVVTIFRERELSEMLQISETKLLVAPSTYRGFDHSDLALRLKAKLSTISDVLIIGEKATSDAISWDEFLAIGVENPCSASSFVDYKPGADEVTELVFTSGTTGSAKGVLHTHNTLGAPVSAICQTLELRSDDVFHMSSTFGHQTGFLGGVRLPIQLGATAVYQDIWDASKFFDLVEQYRISMTSGAPTFLRDIVDYPRKPGCDVSSLRIFRCGGAPIPRALVRQAQEKFPGMNVHSTWGQSENGFVTLTRPRDRVDKIVETDGCAQRGMEVRVVDGNGDKVPAGTEGHLQCRGAFLFVGYAKQPELTRASYRGDWFSTGDLATMDNDGFIRITGRDRDLIIRGGENIPVAYVENALYEDPRISDVALVGMPNERLGEIACAFLCVKGSKNYSIKNMQEHLALAGISKQYWPERLVILNEMPRTPNGKIKKIDLKKLLPVN